MVLGAPGSVLTWVLGATFLHALHNLRTTPIIPKLCEVSVEKNGRHGSLLRAFLRWLVKYVRAGTVDLSQRPVLFVV